MKGYVGLLALLMCGSCSSGGSGSDSDLRSVVDKDIRETRVPGDAREGPGFDSANWDLWPADWSLRPDGPDICVHVGQPCDANSDCCSLLCVGHEGGKVCSVSCEEECPFPGWACRQVASIGQDITFACVSLVETLCRPCQESSDCDGIGGPINAKCVGYERDGFPGTDASFCGAACTDGTTCPADYSCLLVTSVEGEETLQCVRNEGLCPCTPVAEQQLYASGCSIALEPGTCLGKRRCLGGSLTGCDAPIPGAEVCDGLDNDCDGLPDDGIPDCCVCGDGTCHSFCESLATCCPDCHVCGNGECECGESPCDCPQDCCGFCGDSKCARYVFQSTTCCGESESVCPGDCAPGACGNASCEKGENPMNCAQDCQKFACGNNICEPNEYGEELETWDICPFDCGPKCGNCVCEFGEVFFTCPKDCGWCGDGYCSHCEAAAEYSTGAGSNPCVDCCDPRDVCQPPGGEPHECGSDGCSGICGECKPGSMCDGAYCIGASGQACQSDFQCLSGECLKGFCTIRTQCLFDNWTISHKQCSSQSHCDAPGSGSPFDCVQVEYESWMIYSDAYLCLETTSCHAGGPNLPCCIPGEWCGNLRDTSTDFGIACCKPGEVLDAQGTDTTCDRDPGMAYNCRNDNDCPDSWALHACKGAQLTKYGLCVECLFDSHCTVLEPYCFEEHCYRCLNDSHCGGSYKFCMDKICVQCKVDADCKDVAKPKCSSGLCQAAQ